MSLHRMLRAAAGNTGSAPPPASNDAQFNYVSLLLHGDGTNGAQNNAFVDSSTNNFTITRNGNPTQGSLSPYGSLWSNYFDGNGDFLKSPTNTALAFNSVDYTAEAWVYLNMSTYTSFDAGGRGIVSDFLANTTNGRWILYVDTGGKLAGAEQGVGGTSTVTITDSQNMPLQQWVHVAICKSGTTLYLFKNGTLVGTATSAVRTTFGGSINVGQSTVDTNYRAYFQGFISNVRLIKGTALYTSNFTPSTSPLTAVSGTSLLTCQSNRFIDNSANNFTITRNGDVQVTKESPFLPTAAYSTSTIGGSGYFDGSTDWLEITNNTALQLGSSDFCVECWINPTALPTGGNVARFISKNSGYTSLFEYTLMLRDNGAIQADAHTTGYFSIQSAAGLVKANSGWYHVAYSKAGTTASLFVNGVRVATGTLSGTIQSTAAPLAIGRDLEAANREFTGYISDARIVKGSSVYTPSGTTLTVPTAPLTAITNTSLLLNFTNAGIFDNAAENDLETVGNAQLSTSVKKYGTGSLAFDGNGDGLKANNSTAFALSNGNFTIEGWVYLTAYPSNYSGGNYGAAICASKSGGSINSGFEFDVLGTASSYTSLAFVARNGTSNAVFLNPSFSFALNTWYHVAVVKNGSTFTCYVDGTSIGSTTSSTAWTNLSDLNVGWSGMTGYEYYFPGYIDDLRITKGYARYTANFTPPTAAFPDQ